MKTKINAMKRVLTILLLVIPYLTYSQSKSAVAQNDSTCELNRIIEQINNSLQDAKSELKSIKIKKAEIELEIGYDKSGGGGFKIFAKASKKWEKEYSSSMKFSYELPQQDTSLNGFVKSDFNFSKTLSKAVIDAAKMYSSSKKIGVLEKSSLEVKIAFSLNNTTDGGVEFEIWGIGVDISGAIGKKVVHTITLEFGE